MVSSFISSINYPTSLSFHAIPRDFPGDFCSVFCFLLSAMLSESWVDVHMLSQISADQRCEGSSEKSWFGTANRLHCTPYPSWARFSGSRSVLTVLGLPLDMVRARVKFWSGTDGAKSFTRLNLSVPNQFFWYAHFFHPSRAKKFRPCKWGLSQGKCNSFKEASGR